jgi:plasmid stabilization system protein ParE
VRRERPVQIARSAALAIKEAEEWWASNRPKAPMAFLEELETALQLIASQPTVGARARNVKLKGVRRVHLARVHYHLYYQLTSWPETIEVLALWHTSRGKGPQL